MSVRHCILNAVNQKIEKKPQLKRAHLFLFFFSPFSLIINSHSQPSPSSLKMQSKLSNLLPVSILCLSHLAAAQHNHGGEMEDMPAFNSTGDEPMSYWDFPDNKGLLYTHIAFMVLAFWILMPMGKQDRHSHSMNLNIEEYANPYRLTQALPLVSLVRLFMSLLKFWHSAPLWLVSRLQRLMATLYLTFMPAISIIPWDGSFFSFYGVRCL
jgi:hypothetical protein